MSEQSLDSLFEEASAIQKQIELLRTKINDSIFNKIKEIVPVKFKDINFKCILASGYTPGFNDGDPCTHTFDMYYGKRNTYTDSNGTEVSYFDFDYFDDFESLFEDEDIDVSSIEAGNTDVLPVISEEDGEVIKSFFDGVNLLCEQTGITNFQIVVFKKKDGEVVVEIDEDYDVGH